ncbi:WXG100 family type VII secretion target [Streptomyces catenulae]|uniref:WXG100 family type VII secretion target n=1 Tax=Streptomyces catenulae TaxID=66875 RepID=A0ABV2Z010_9ACTN|nr:WXG100 family type VII secretion target [Streptomyces catenulae]
MADPTNWSDLLNSFYSKGLPGGTAIDPIPPLEAVTEPRWTKAYWNYALGQDPFKGQWVTRYDDGRGLSRTAGITMKGEDEQGPDSKDSAWPKLNMGSFHVIQALAGTGTDVTSLPSFTNAEQQLKGAIQYFNNFHIGLDQWRAKMDDPESGWKGSASSAFADVLLRLSRAFEEIDTLTGGPDGNGGYLGAVAQARDGLRAAVDEMQQMYSTWGSQPTWSPAGALQQVLSGLNVDHKDNPGGGQGTTKLTHSEYGELGYVDQQGTWDLIEQHAKDLWLQTAQQYLNGMVGDVHTKLSQAYNTSALALKPVPPSIENAINGGGYGSQTPPGGTGDDTKDKDKDKGDGTDLGGDKDLGSGDKDTGNGDGDLPPGQSDGDGLGDGKGLGDTSDLAPGQTDGNGLGDGKGLGDTSDLAPGQTDSNGLGDGKGLGDTSDLSPGQTDSNGLGDGKLGPGSDLPPGQTDTDPNHYVPPYLRNPGGMTHPGSTDVTRKNPSTGYGKGNNLGGNTTYKPPRPGQTDPKRWMPHDVKNYTPPRLSSGNSNLSPGTTGTGTGTGGLQTSSTGGSGASGANGAGGARGPISTSSTGGKNGSGVPLFPPMANGMGGGKGQENQERERTTWLAEDASVWGTDPELAPTVLGRPGTQLFADTAYQGETDEWQPAAGPYGGRPGTSGGGARPGQGGAGESRPGQRDGYGQGSSAQRHG